MWSKANTHTHTHTHTRGDIKRFRDYFASKPTDGSTGMRVLWGFSSNRHQAVYRVASFCEQRVLCKLEQRANIKFCVKFGISAPRLFA